MKQKREGEALVGQHGDMSRRSFLLGSVGAMSFGAATAMVGCASQPSSKDSAESKGEVVQDTAQSDFGIKYPWQAKPPVIDEAAIEEEMDVDVAVVGLGVSGVAAFRSAVESGAKVAGFEKGAVPSVRSQQYCYINGSLTEQFGLPALDEDELIEHEWNQCAQMTNYSIIRNFVRNQSDSFDWWIQGDDELYVPQKGETIAMTGDEQHPNSICVMSDPSVDYRAEAQASYPCRFALTDHEHVVNANLQKGLDQGGSAYFGHFAEQLITNDDGRVTGVYIRNSDTGKYKKVNASKGVVLAAGGCGSNEEMIKTFYPAMAENGNLSGWPNFDVEGNPTNTGDAYKMGYWAGAAFSQMMAPMCHVMGGPGDSADMAQSMGLTSPHLRLNYNGQRFMNEDTNCSDTELVYDRQPKRKAFLFFDSHLDEQLPSCILDFPTTLAELDAKVDGKTVFKGETIDELLASIPDMDVDEAKVSIERYNEMCAAGVDEDFGKQQKYLWALEDGPFYAQRMGIGLCLTTMGGLSSDEYARVLGTNRNPIAGLYVSGNSQGDRFAVKYPFKLSGASHAMALYYGKVAGENAAVGV